MGKNARRRTGCELVAELLSDGEPHSHRELYALNVIAHSRVADLRKRGFVIDCWQDDDPRTGERVHWYQLRSLPQPAMEYSPPPSPASGASGTASGATQAGSLGVPPASLVGEGAEAAAASSSRGGSSMERAPDVLSGDEGSTPFLRLVPADVRRLLDGTGFSADGVVELLERGGYGELDENGVPASQTALFGTA